MFKQGIAVLLIIWGNLAFCAEKPLSIVFSDAPVSHILQALADHRQLNLVIAPGVESKLSLRLVSVPWNQAIDIVRKISRLIIIEEGNVLLVYPETWNQQAEQREADKRETERQNQPLITRAIALRYADATVIHASLMAEKTKLMSERGSVVVDLRTNSLLLRDTEKALTDVAAWISALDVAVEQIELIAHIVTISEEYLRELGVNWTESHEESISRALRNTALNINLGVSQPIITTGFTLARLDGRLLGLELSALESENKIEIIASPRLFTSHLKPASIKQGSEIPYEVSTGTSGATTVEFKEAVLGMEVTPAVQANGHILLKLQISQNVPGRNVRYGNSEMLSIDKQEIKTEVMLKDGQTLALGGIFQQQKSQGQSRVPFLGNIPLIGSLFSHDVSENKKRELVIFITPRLIRNE